MCDLGGGIGGLVRSSHACLLLIRVLLITHCTAAARLLPRLLCPPATNADGVLAWIEDKIAVLTGIPTGFGEPFNVLRYENGQHYDSHFDAFDEAAYGKQPSQRVSVRGLCMLALGLSQQPMHTVRQMKNTIAHNHRHRLPPCSST